VHAIYTILLGENKHELKYLFEEQLLGENEDLNQGLRPAGTGHPTTELL
jgi:hypothetical protein